MLLGLALAALLSVQDPVGDTTGNGTLTLPTAALFESRSPFDVTAIGFLDTPTLGIELSLASLVNPLELPLGFSFPIIELYISDTVPGNTDLLPGSGMRLPQGATWHYALQLSGEALKVFVAEEGTVVELAHASDVSLEDSTLRIETSLPRPERFTLFGMVGQYTPFSRTGWQPLSPTPSPWAFSSSTQTYPVIDVISVRTDLQERALQTGVLPGLRRTSTPRAAFEFNAWIGLMGLGVVTALVGLIGRFTGRSQGEPSKGSYVPSQAPDQVPQATPPEPPPSSARVADAATSARAVDKDTSQTLPSYEQRDGWGDAPLQDTVAANEKPAQSPVLNEAGWLEADTDAEALSDWEAFDDPDDTQASELPPFKQKEETSD